MPNRRSLLKTGGAVIAGALVNIGTTGVASAASPRCSDIDPLALVDPELREAAAEIKATYAKFPPLSLQTLPQTRTIAVSGGPAPLDSVPFTEQKISGLRGNPDVGIYVVNAQLGASRPGIVYMHGGGFILGNAKSSVRELQELSAALDCCIVSVDYRLAPETRYSGSIEDNYAGLLWMHAHAKEIGVDPVKIAVMGESAGGGHAALLAITARDRGEVAVLFQMLVYPMLDDRTGSTRHMPKYIGAYVWDEAANHFGWRSFLGREPGGARVPVGGVPARVANLCGLPPAFIGVGSVDLFANEDIEYAGRLLHAGVPTELLVVPGAFHGFDHNPTATVSKRFNRAKLNALRRAFGISMPESSG